MQEIKKLFFTYRNGAVADTLRRYGIPHKVIFGLQIPQLAAIARELQFGTPADREAAADKLWADREVRESRLLACYLFDPQTITLDKALELYSRHPHARGIRHACFPPAQAPSRRRSNRRQIGDVFQRRQYSDRSQANCCISAQPPPVSNLGTLFVMSVKEGFGYCFSLLNLLLNKT